MLYSELNSISLPLQESIVGVSVFVIVPSWITIFSQLYDFFFNLTNKRVGPVQETEGDYQ